MEDRMKLEEPGRRGRRWGAWCPAGSGTNSTGQTGLGSCRGQHLTTCKGLIPKMIHLNWAVGISCFQVFISILAGVTAFTSYWGVIPSKSSHFGLIEECPMDRNSDCNLVGLTGDVINLLSAVMVVGIITSFPYCIVEMVKGLRCHLFLCFVSGLMGVLSYFTRDKTTTDLQISTAMQGNQMAA
ncbi:uncharacterized protein [Pyxicephalus adspersus]|uniref:uncharacterized protein isoform X2 n=1 Tax=Pyxicephalus adspersus TaxID=30357 RepID=UPI003B5A38EE